MAKNDTSKKPLVKLIHNKSAGDGGLDKKHLVKLITDRGFACEYSSTNSRNWKELAPHTGWIAVAGGDGTIRKVTRHQLGQNKLTRLHPVSVIPTGTANNISRTLNITGTPEEIIAGWEKAGVKKIDIGILTGLDTEEFFMESFGFGIFPYLMLEMKDLQDKHATAEDQIRQALTVLSAILERYKAKKCDLLIDGKDYSGEYIMAEVMNMKSIGPNLLLCPDSDPGDGFFEVVLMGREDKDKFASYISEKLAGNDPDYDFRPIRAKQIEIRWEGRHVHTDDVTLKIRKAQRISIEIRPGLIEFLV